MKKLIFGAALLIGYAAMAGEPSAKLTGMVDGLLEKCPVDISRGWVIQSASADEDGVTLTMIVDTTADKFSEMEAKKDDLKKRFLTGFAAKAKHGGLIGEAAASGLPLTVDIVCPESVETIALTFTPDELSGAVGDKADA